MTLFGGIEAALQGATFGLSDKLGVTGDGSVLQLLQEDDPDKQAVLVNKAGLVFLKSKTAVRWSDVKEIALQEEGLFRIELRGGLIVLTGWIHWDEDWLSRNNKECRGACNHKSLIGDDIDLDVYDEDLATALEDVFWASDLADKIRDSEHIVLVEFNLLRHYYVVYLVLLDILDEIEASDDEEKLDKRFHRFLGIIEKFDELLNIIKSQMARVDGDDEDEFDLIAGLFAQSRGRGNGVTKQAKLYDNLRNARAYGYKFDDDEPLAVLTSDLKEEGFKPFGDSEWANLRRTIVCTDERAALTTWHEGLQIPNVMVMDAHDIKAYIDAAENDKRLIFELGHPQNGMTYVQHPMQQNVYIDLDSFHSSLLEQKYEEFKKILKALGAVYITCKVTNSDSTDEKQRRKMTGGVEGNIPVGEVASKFEHSGVSSKKSDIYKELETEIRNPTPKTKPYLPDGLIFYPFEASWKNLAESALNGTIKEEETTLTYRKDYAVTGQNLKSIEIKLKSLVPGYQFGVGGSFAHEIESELKQLKSTVWHYHVIFENEAGERAGANNATASTASAVPANTDANKVELLFAKRAKRYAQSEGHINAEQRADLEAFAQKYGIDEFRMEELIEEAFV